MGNEQEPGYIDFDQILRDIQEENHQRLSEILDERIPSSPVEFDRSEKRLRMTRIFDLFIPPGSR